MPASKWLALGLVFLPGAAAAEMLSYSSGTGFFVHDRGMVLTNLHVVRGCGDIMLHGAVPDSKAVLVAVDESHDLALLKSEAIPMRVAALNSEKQPLRPGDPVVVTGYPGQSWQAGQPESREAKIIATRGPRGEEQWLQFSDALSQGNSGGPLLDAAGHVVGVVVAKGKLVRQDELSGTQEVVDSFDLAISLPVVRRFLKAQGVPFDELDSSLMHSTQVIEDDARQFVVNVRCQLMRPD